MNNSTLEGHLEEIRFKYGKLTPAQVVEDARPKDHPLHARFEWNDVVAGHRYRLEQAHTDIQSIKVSYTDKEGSPQQVRRYHAVKQADGFAYQVATEMDDFATKEVLDSMQLDWKILRRRYARFAEFLAMIREEIA